MNGNDQNENILDLNGAIIHDELHKIYNFCFYNNANNDNSDNFVHFNIDSNSDFGWNILFNKNLTNMLLFCIFF